MTSYPPPPENQGGEQPPTYPSYPQYPQGQGGMPGYPPGGGYDAAPVAQPSSIQRAVLLMRVGAGLSLLNVIVGLITLGSIKDNIKQRLIDDNNYSQSNLDTAYNVAIVVVIVLGVIAIALWLWMAWANGAGKKWARIVATVLAAFSILGLITTFAQGQQTAVGDIFTVVISILAIVILVLIWNRESSAYYEAKSRKQLY